MYMVFCWRICRHMCIFPGLCPAVPLAVPAVLCLITSTVPPSTPLQWQISGAFRNQDSLLFCTLVVP